MYIKYTSTILNLKSLVITGEKDFCLMDDILFNKGLYQSSDFQTSSTAGALSEHRQV